MLFYDFFATSRFYSAFTVETKLGMSQIICKTTTNFVILHILLDFRCSSASCLPEPNLSSRPSIDRIFLLCSRPDLPEIYCLPTKRRLKMFKTK